MRNGRCLSPRGVAVRQAGAYKRSECAGRQASRRVRAYKNRVAQVRIRSARVRHAAAKAWRQAGKIMRYGVARCVVRKGGKSRCVRVCGEPKGACARQCSKRTLRRASRTAAKVRKGVAGAVKPVTTWNTTCAAYVPRGAEPSVRSTRVRAAYGIAAGRGSSRRPGKGRKVRGSGKRATRYARRARSIQRTRCGAVAA